MFSILPLFVSVSFAANYPPPNQMCTQDLRCTSAMLSIADEFNKSELPPELDSIPQVFSGECFYLNQGTDPYTTQYGVVLLDGDTIKPTFSGLFAYQEASDPYADLNVSQAREILKNGGSDPVPLQMQNTCSAISYDSAQASLRYWLRQSTQNLILVAQWIYSGPSPVQEIFCRLKAHSPAKKQRS